LVLRRIESLTTKSIKVGKIKAKSTEEKKRSEKGKRKKEKEET